MTAFNPTEAARDYTIMAALLVETKEGNLQGQTAAQKRTEAAMEDLEELAAQQGLYFHGLQGVYTLEPMSEQMKRERATALAAEREEIARQLQHEANVNSVTRSHFDSDEAYEEWEINNR